MSIPHAGSWEMSSFQQLRLLHDAEARAVWLFMDPKPRPNFNPVLLSEFRAFQDRAVYLVAVGEVPADELRYVVLASAAPSVFNLGGDLALFMELIEARDRDGLLAYGKTCIDCVYQNAVGMGIPGLTTISLVQGAAMGGGFEAALSSHVVVAERGARMGFPEILFNLFPGMGAYNLLTRRISPVQAERMLHSGAQYSAQELFGLGLVDVLAEDGEGIAAVKDYIHRHARGRKGHLAIHRVHERLNPLNYDELAAVVTLWADAALKVSSRDLRRMERLVLAQDKVQREKAGTPGLDVVARRAQAGNG